MVGFYRLVLIKTKIKPYKCGSKILNHNQTDNKWYDLFVYALRILIGFQFLFDLCLSLILSIST